MSQRLRFQDAVPARNPSRRSLHEKQRSRRRVENIGDGLLPGHDTQPAINVAASSKQRVSRNGLASPGGARYPKVTNGRQLGIATQFGLCASDRIIRGSDRRSTCGTPFLPKLRPPGRRALFSIATNAGQCPLWNGLRTLATHCGMPIRRSWRPRPAHGSVRCCQRATNFLFLLRNRTFQFTRRWKRR